MAKVQLSRTVEDVNTHFTKSIAINLLKPSRYQIRDAAFFSKEDLQKLANSIRSRGLLENPKVRRCPEDPEYFEIISGHRRVSAASEILGWREINCEVGEYESEVLVFQLCLEENLQQHNLSPYEEGIAFLLGEKLFGLSQFQIAQRFRQPQFSVESKQQLARSVNSYLKYAEPEHVNGFLRHASLEHISAFPKIDQVDLKYAIKMIATGATPETVERFGSFFGRTNEAAVMQNAQ